MGQINTHRNIPVKTERENYSYARVVATSYWAHNRCMKNLRTLRKAKRLSQSDLADMVNVTQSFISKIEKGDGNPSLDVIEAIARALGVTPIALFELPEFHARVLSALDRLPANRRDVALDVLEAMSDRPTD